MEKLEARKPLAFLVGLVLLPVMVTCVDTLGVLTTKDESDLSFLLAGIVIEGTASGVLAFLFFKGKILALTSCKLWSGLVMKKETNTRGEHATMHGSTFDYQYNFCYLFYDRKWFLKNNQCKTKIPTGSI